MYRLDLSSLGGFLLDAGSKPRAVNQYTFQEKGNLRNERRNLNMSAPANAGAFLTDHKIIYRTDSFLTI